MPGTPTHTAPNGDTPPATRRGARRRASRAGAATEVTRVLTRDVSPAVQNLLWGRAAGRCQFNNCNRVLSRVPATQETRNLAEKAHIYAFSPGGPRAGDAWPAALLNDVENLLLVCHDCHVTIDRGDGPDRYTAARLMDMKRRHEQRVEIATDVAPDLASHVLTYGTHVGAHLTLPSFRDAAAALFPARYPAQPAMLELGARGGSQRDRDDAFWREQRRELAYQFDRQVRRPIECGEVGHLSVFALAPQPLLIDLGVLLGDITPADVYQRHREPPGWGWPSALDDSTAIDIVEPTHEGGVPALVLAVSATVTPDRVRRVLGDDAAIWAVAVPEPHNDVVKARATVGDFRRSVRRLLDRMKARHGHATPIHVFPALPVSLAVEFGRVRMPKADAPWVLYDEQQALGGFVPAFTLDGAS